MTDKKARKRLAKIEYESTESADFFDISSASDPPEYEVTRAILYGSQRVGKTFALKYFVKHALKSYDISAPVYMHCAHDETSAELLFLQSLLTSTGHSLDLPSRLGPARKRLTEHLEYQAINAHDNRVVLVGQPELRAKATEFG
jgi:Cdc6-like AAA superfamily ATPase